MLRIHRPNTGPSPPSTSPTAPGRTRSSARPPTWCSVDLRDGNQALIEPMDAARKRRMFDMLIRIGFKEIEVGFPAASQTDFDFVREIIEQQPDPGRCDHSSAHAGAPRADRAHLRVARRARAAPSCTCTTPPRVAQRRVVFRTDRAGIVDIAVRGATLRARARRARSRYGMDIPVQPRELHRHRARFRGGDLRCRQCGVGAHAAAPVHLESAGDGRDGDAQCLCRPDRVVRTAHRAQRDSIVLSVHPHNDRGTAVAAAELAVMAGARAGRGHVVRQRRADRQRRHRDTCP